MIGRVLKRGSNLAGLLYYLYGPGKACEHVNPHLVAGWRHPAELEPPLRPDGKPGLPQADRADAAAGGAARRTAPRPSRCGTARSAPRPATRTWATARGCGSPRRSWTAPACPATARKTRRCRWVAVHHGGNHIHIVATLARQDGRRAHLHNEYYRIGEALRDIEAEYGLVAVARADRTAARQADPGRDPRRRPGPGRPSRPGSRCAATWPAAAAAARSEPEFFAALARRGVQVRLRYSDRNPGRGDRVRGRLARSPDRGRGSRSGSAAGSWPRT